ncbi:uncharacterized protein spmip4 isoform X4 [Oncorhynchus kisutch]|uniref:uncharacterized protein spmip4 isoform X4 n=1 Tax=Oncorhynchus kisutch TaxID=8019 RepID=UPI0009A04616|nr:uncharacterized protein LOC116352717 isoform X4 [Oncorhynchus kisutch]XP_031668056.1 uncharacterized protein LOC116352717 isoform X4 [Oncorhynchus kisutch]
MSSCSPLPRGPSSRVPPLPGVPSSSSSVLPSDRTQRRLSQHSSHKMASSSSSSQKSKHTPAIIKGHRHLSYGGSVPPENITIQQFYDLTPTKKSNLRLNDQLIPKPTDINIGEIMIKVPIPKEHPYQTHISRFALFPTFRSPDDPDTGVRAASLRPLNPLVPSSAPEVTVLRKTKGGPYRHEVLEAPMTTRKKTISWPGQHGFLDHPKPVKGEAQTQVFYPKSQKTVFPNPTLRDWDVTLSERTANMLRNVEKSHWVTSYQLHYTGTGSTNPWRLDDYHENTVDMITGKTTPYTTQLRERSHPVLLPPKPRDGRKARIRQGRHKVESTYHPPVTAPAAESHSTDQTSTQNHPAGPLGTMSGHQSHQEIKRNPSTQDGHPNNSHGHSELSLARPGAGDVSVPEPAQVSGYVFPGHHLQDHGSRCERCGEERCECQVKEVREGLHHPGPGASDPQQSSQAPRASLEKVTDTESPLALYSCHSPLNETTEVTKENNTQREVWYEDIPSSKKQSYTASGGNLFSLSQPVPALATNNTGAAYESETELSAADLVSPNIRNWRSGRNLVLGSEMTVYQTLEEQDREWQNSEIPIPRSISNPCIQPRPHALPSTHPGERGRCQLALLELQDSFSKSEVHRLFHSSLQGGAVDLQDNVHTGRKHRFYGFNSFYFHN